jgi:hypothetical protein
MPGSKPKTLMIKDAGKSRGSQEKKSTRVRRASTHRRLSMGFARGQADELSEINYDSGSSSFSSSSFHSVSSFHSSSSIMFFHHLLIQSEALVGAICIKLF